MSQSYSATQENVIATEAHPSPTVLVSTSEGQKRVQAEASSAVQSVWKLNQISTSSTLGGLFNGGQNIIFDIRSLSICYIKKIVLELTITNTHATSNAVLVNAPFLFQYMTLYAGGNSVFNYDADSQWFAYLPTLDIPKTTLRSELENWDATTYSSATGAGTTGNGLIAAGATQKIYVEINCLLNTAEVPVAGGLTNVEPWRCQFYLTGAPFVSTSPLQTTANLQMTNAQMFVFGEEVSPRALARLDQELKSSTHTWQTHTPLRQVLNLGTINLSAGTTTINQSLTGFDGTFSSITAFLRAANAQGEQLYQYDYTTGSPSTVPAASPAEWLMNNLSIQDSSGAPIYVSQIPDKVLRLAPGRLLRDSLFPTVFSTYEFDFSMMPDAAVASGRAVADVRVRTNWSFFANPLSGATGQTAVNTEIVFIAQRLTMIDLLPTGRWQVRFL